MRWFIFRNNTVERFFGSDCRFSGYEDVSVVPTDADGYVWFYQMPIATDAAVVAAQIRSYISSLQLVLTQVAQDKLFVALTMEDMYSAQVVATDRQVSKARGQYNRFLWSQAAEGRMKVIDFSDFTMRYKQSDLIDWKYYFLTQIGLNPRLATEFKQWFNRQIEVLSLKRRKCLVLDLDNTLWGGILGEDGADGIACAGDYPGKAFHWWQEALLNLSKTGVILALCSKNNLSDVEELWAKNPNMVLHKEHFAAYRINWQDKATNLRELAQELNIGLDSMVFIDDSPTERELIQQLLPEVAVPDFPQQPYDLPKLYKLLVDNFFTVYSLTDEDRQKTAQYRANAERREAQAAFADFNDYIKSLQIKLDIHEVDEFSIVRAAQMTQKTNQFNLTTKRYTEADLRQMLAEGAKIYTLAVSDKFGDYGITGLCIIIAGEIDTFLMSCRVLGKRIEQQFLQQVLALCEDNTLYSTYIPTAKNSQVAEFYEDNGFRLIEDNNGIKRYIWNRKY